MKIVAIGTNTHIHTIASEQESHLNLTCCPSHLAGIVPWHSNQWVDHLRACTSTHKHTKTEVWIENSRTPDSRCFGFEMVNLNNFELTGN